MDAVTTSWPELVVLAVLVVTAGLCAVGLARPSGRRSPRVIAAEANHLLMAVAMTAMALPATADVVPPVAGVGVFALLAAAWVVVLVAGRRAGRPTLSPVADPGCAANPVHLGLANAAMVAMVGAGAVTTSGSGATLLALDLGVVALSFYLLARAGGVVGALLAPRVEARRRAPRVPAGVGAGDDGGAVPDRVDRVDRVDRAGPVRPVDSGRAQLGCEALMAATMAWMLLAVL